MFRRPAPRILSWSFLLVAAAPCVLQAHPGHEHRLGWEQGFVHPLTGLDHLLAMLAVGIWAAQLGGRARWLLPLSFVSAMAGGAALARAGVWIPGVETIVLTSVFLLGLAVAVSLRAPLAATGGLTAFFALAHGYAHGVEGLSGESPVGYGAGFLTATLLLLLTGFGAGSLAAGIRRQGWLRWAGIGIAAGGFLCLGA